MYYSEITKNQCFDPEAVGAIFVPENHAWQSPAPEGSYFEYPTTGLPVLHAIDQTVLDAMDWVSDEFTNTDEQILKIQMNDPNQISTVEAWSSYADELDAYVVGYAIVTEQPTRPT